MCVSMIVPADLEVNTVNKDNEPQNSTAKTLPNKFLKVKEKYLKIHNEMVNTKTSDNKTEKKTESDDEGINTDILARSSVVLRMLLKHFESFKSSKLYTMLSRTSQPAHIIMITAVLVLMSILMPTSDKKHNQKSPLISFIYLSSFVVHFGSQIWMTFVSGLSLYFALSRHAFGEVQRVLFPRYFTINAILSLTTLLTFVKHHPVHTWDVEIKVQIGGIAAAFLTELLIRLYLVRPLLHLMFHKIALEQSAGTGKEVGRHILGPLKDCPHYIRIHQAFKKLHMIIAMGNIFTMACTVSHLYYISLKLSSL